MKRSRILALGALTVGLVGSFLAIAPASAITTTETVVVAGSAVDPTPGPVVDAGQTVTISATGSIFTNCPVNHQVTIDGQAYTRINCPNMPPSGDVVVPTATPTATPVPLYFGTIVPGIPAGNCPGFSLVFREVGDTAWLCAGAGPTSFTGSGKAIQFWMYDDQYGDNAGAWTVTIAPVAVPPVTTPVPTCTAAPSFASALAAPIPNKSNVVAGSTVPVKLKSSSCALQLPAGQVPTIKVTGPGTPNQTSTSAADTTGTLRWSGDQYIYNLNTGGDALGVHTVTVTWPGGSATGQFTVVKK